MKKGFLMGKDYIQTNLGQKIKKLRKLKGYSQEVFAEKIGIATNSLSSIETGNSFMTSNTLDKITQELEISLNELFDFDDCKSNKDMYTFIIHKLDYLKNNEEKITLIYKIIKAIF